MIGTILIFLVLCIWCLAQGVRDLLRNRRKRAKS